MRHFLCFGIAAIWLILGMGKVHELRGAMVSQDATGKLAQTGDGNQALPTFIVAGQSNAFRLGRISTGESAPAGAMFFHVANTSCTSPENLDVKVQTFSADQRLGGFGAGIAQAIGSKFPHGFAIVSYAVCGSDLHTEWMPTQKDGYYRKFFEPFVAKSLKDIEIASGQTPKVMGMLWHQGESNSNTQDEIVAYRKLMPEVIGNFRKSFGATPFLLGEIREFEDKPFRAAINQQMREIAESDPAVGVVSLQDCGWQSPTDVHFSVSGANTAGHRLVKEWELLQTDVAKPDRGKSGDPPNILFFLVDDMGWQDTSVPFHTETTQLNRDYRTPNMERLANQSLLFTDAYACAICSPTRVSLMTGQNAARHGVTCWTLRKDTSPENENKKFGPANWRLNGLQPVGTKIPNSFASQTLPERLRGAGYRTIHAGKGHFGAKDTPGANPKNLGFDINIAGSYMGGPGSYHGDKNFSAAWRGGDSIWNIPGLEKYHGKKINLMEAITREAVVAVEKSVADDQPFYLYMSHYGVHAPFEADRRFLPDFENSDWTRHKKIYASMLAGMDKSLGDLMNALDRLNIAENTIIIFMSDNGSPGNNPQNLPLRGDKISGFEGGTRVPMMISWPNKTPGNTRTDTPIIIEDIFPTILEIAGLKPNQRIDGVSFVDVVENPATDRSKRPLFWHYPNFYHRPPYSSVRLGNLKLIYWHVRQQLELFDLNADIGESRDLSAKRPEDVERLAKILADFLRQSDANMPTIRATGAFVPWPDEVVTTPSNE